MNNSIYKTFISAKNGHTIPVLQNNRTVESKYNPQREADNIVSEINENCTFFIVLGIASGALLESLNNKYPTSKIIAIETSKDDIDFLLQLDDLSSLKNNENIIFTDIENIEETLINNYVPSLYGNFKIIEQKAWLQYNIAALPLLNKKINKAMGIISSDYSVQCHFGKIWQSNIMNNLKLISNNHIDIKYPSIDNKKTAIIVAAGPSLENKIKELQVRSDIFIIATDTAYQTLSKYEIDVDIVISIDGQHISHNHFMNIKKDSKTIFALDLCSDHSVSKYLFNKKQTILYFRTGHPLSNYANNYFSSSLLELFSGAGTVTITALDLALKLGFKNINILGGDFSYIDGKAYVKGTYFDTIYGKDATKLKTVENFFDRLMYRTELIKIDNSHISTIMLNAYKNSLELYLRNNNCTYYKKNDEYVIEVHNSNNKNIVLEAPTFDFKRFIYNIKNNSKETLLLPLLPYIAWLRNKSDKQEDIVTLLKLAQSNIVIYN